MKLIRVVGMDGAVTFALLARGLNIVGSVGTVLLVVRYLSPVEQGYYYALLSLVSLQLVFELGFSFVIQQLAAHECVHVELREDGSVGGDRVALARLASILQMSMRWYSWASLAMGLVLTPLGVVFFGLRASPGSVHVAWQGPWMMAVAASMAGLWCLPFYGFLEGCGEVRTVAALRLRQALAANVLAWTAMLLGHGLYAPALVIVGQVGVGLMFLANRRRLLAGLLGYPACEAGLSWTDEVWPFQWRIGVSWMCSYLTVQVFIPIVFALRGPVEAGQMGMSLSVTGYMTVLALVWISTKATPFGQLIAKRDFSALDQSFFRTLSQSVAAFAIIAAVATAAVAAIPFVAPHLGSRMVPAWMFAMLVLGAGANHVVQCLAILLRCFKREPFLVQSLAVAALTLLLAAALVPKLGNAGACIGYLLANLAVGLPVASLIFARTRSRYLAAAPPSQPGLYAAAFEPLTSNASGDSR